MLCSVPNGKSGPNWLDRLRSSKGFPAADNHDLDHFLNNHCNSDADSPPANPSGSILNSNFESTQSDDKQDTADRSRAAETLSGNGDKEWLGVMTNVLCDLFNMGESNQEIPRFSRKKSARKQTNPKFCDVSAPSIANDIDSMRKDECIEAATASLHSDKNSNAGTNADCEDRDIDDEEKDKSSSKNGKFSDNELKGYSRSEVTVIDTSFEVWKFDKLVFRKKNIWKILDKKGKSWSFGTKKRKGNHLESANGNVGYNKKAKSSKDSNGGIVWPMNHGMEPQNEKQEEVCKGSHHNHSQVAKKRIHFSGSPGKSKMNGSSVVLIKAIPTSKKCRKSHPKNRHKETQRE